MRMGRYLELKSELDGFAFACIQVAENSKWLFLYIGYLCPSRQTFSPIPNHGRSAAVHELSLYSGRKEDSFVEEAKGVEVANLEEIVERPGIGNDEHCF